MPFNFPQIRISTFGRGVALALVLVMTSVIVTSVITFQQSNKMARAWEDYNTVTAKKGIILSHLRDLLGYDGMIHHYKNFILRKERNRSVTTYQRMLEISIALTAYQSFGLAQEEIKAINLLAETLDKYRSAMRIAEKFAAQDLSSNAIDQIVKIDDTPASIALEILDKELYAARQASEKNVYGTVNSLISFVSLSAILTGLFVFALVA